MKAAVAITEAEISFCHSRLCKDECSRGPTRERAAAKRAPSPEAFRFRAQCFALQPDAAALRPPATPDRTGAFLACARAAASCTLSKRFFAFSSCCTFWCSFASRVIGHGVARVHFLATSYSSCFQSCRMCTTDTALALSSCCPRTKSIGRPRHIHCAVLRVLPCRQVLPMAILRAWSGSHQPCMSKPC